MTGLRVLVDVTHPAHVHLFRHAIEALESAGHEVRVTSREKDVTTDLLDAHDIPHTVLSQRTTGRGGVLREWIPRALRLLRVARSFRPDVVVSRLNPAATHVANAIDVPSVVFHDTEVAGVVDRVTTPFAHTVCTPLEYGADFGGAHVRYAGFHELAYLHPARFTPQRERLREHGVRPDEPYAVVRLVDMNAHHDRGHDGFDPDTVRELCGDLSKHGSVFVTSEGGLPTDLAPYELPVPPEAVHDLLAFADVYVGDSATMATEAGVLGTPSVRFDAFGASMGNFDALADYGLVESTTDASEAAEAAVALAADPDAGDRWRRRRQQLLAEKIDVTAFVTDVVENAGRD